MTTSQSRPVNIEDLEGEEERGYQRESHRRLGRRRPELIYSGDLARAGALRRAFDKHL